MSHSSLFVVMGVSGSGKTTVAQRLAEATLGRWLDADDFHSPENKAKMAAGIPLTDADRWPWLDRLVQELNALAGDGQDVFLACSALKQRYRDRLKADIPDLRFVYLKGSFEAIHARMLARRNHFMPAGLLESQFADLEEPTDAIVLDGERPVAELVQDFLSLIGNV